MNSRFPFYRRLLMMMLLTPFPWFLGELTPENPPNTHTEQGDITVPSPAIPAEPCVGC